MPAVIDIENGTLGAQYRLTRENGTVRVDSEEEAVYYVLADNAAQTSANIKATGALPQLGGVLNGRTVVDVDPHEETRVIHPVTGTATILWKVTVRTDSTVPPNTDTSLVADWEGDQDRMHLERDIVTGKRIQTTAGEPIFTETDECFPILCIKRQETHPFDPTTQILYVNRVNRLDFYGFPPGTGKMISITAPEGTVDGIKICNVEYRIKFRILLDALGQIVPFSWMAWELNQGYYYRQEPGKKPIMNLDKTGNPLKVNLKRDGTKLLDFTGTDLLYRRNDAFAYGFDYTAKHYMSSLAMPATPDDVGGVLKIVAGSNPQWVPGDYDIVAVEKWPTAADIYYWILNARPTNTGAFGDPPQNDGHFTLERPPIYLPFHRHYPVDFNVLSLGP